MKLVLKLWSIVVYMYEKIAFSHDSEYYIYIYIVGYISH